MQGPQGTITITFGEVAENHVRMQKIGEIAENGFTFEELKSAEDLFKAVGCVTELVNLGDSLPLSHCRIPAAVLIIRNGVDVLLKGEVDAKKGKTSPSDHLNKQLLGLEWDTKAMMYGRVVNKNARYNLCFSEENQEPNYEAGNGRIISFGHESLSLLTSLRSKLPEYLGDKAKLLNAEGNLYYDASKCGIGWHGDAERKKVVALRLGEKMPLHYQWFYQGHPIGDTIKLTLSNGDIYVMSEKASGWDWRKKVVPTLRHAAGAAKFLKLPTRSGGGKGNNKKEKQAVVHEEASEKSGSESEEEEEEEEVVDKKGKRPSNSKGDSSATKRFK